MRSVAALLGGGYEKGRYTLRDPAPRDPGRMVKQHGRLYVAEGAWLARVMMVLPFPARLSTTPSVPPCVIVEGCAVVDYA